MSSLSKADQPDETADWPMWVLSPEDIEGVARERGISYLGKDFDEIARVTKKGIEAALCDVWEVAIEEALRNTEAEWQFSIMDVGLVVDSSEYRSGRCCSATKTWVGEIGCEAEGTSLIFAFELVHSEADDDTKDEVKIMSIRHPDFNETEWEDLCSAMEAFILTVYKTTDWRQR